MNVLLENYSYMKYSIFFVGILFFSFFSCEKSAINSLQENNDLKLEEMNLSMEPSDQFFKELSSIYNGKDFVHSPLSIQLALYMALNGADGVTKKEIKNLLGESGNADLVINQKVKSIQAYFNELLDKGTIDIANAGFYDKNRVNLNADFSTILNDYFGASIGELDFKSEEAVAEINNWASDNTNGKIEKILESISDEEILFLLNAIYLNADWDYPFDPEATRADKFYVSDQKESEVDFMFKDGGFEYLNNDMLSLVRMPLSDTSLYAWFIMPKNVSLQEWNKEFRYANLQSYSKDLNSGRLMVFLPKYKTKMHQNLNSILVEMGMPTAFDPSKSDFTNLGEVNTGQNIYLSRVIHDAFLQVDEKGVEGAAVTSVGFGVTSLPPVVKFDRPFAYFIVDAQTDIPLFAGQFYNNPSTDEW